MSFRATLAAAVLAGLAGAAVAQPVTLPQEDAVPGRIAAHIYINLATGERIITREPMSTPRAPFLFENSDGRCVGYWFQSVDDPARDPGLGRARFGGATVHWADMAERSFITAFSFAYTTDMSLGYPGDPGGPFPIPGFNLIATFFRNYEGDLDPGGSLATPIATVRVESLYGTDAWTDIFGYCASFIGLCGAIAYVDLEGSGSEFYIGNPDEGALDLDADGLYDFGYSYSFEQEQTPKGRAGAALVRPASFGGHGSATTAPDALEWFNQPEGPLTGYVGRYWFGGGRCGAGGVIPWASLYLELYGYSRAASCATIDYTADGQVEFADYLEFLNFYDAADPRADLSADGLVDFADYLVFLNFYEQCG